METSPEPETLSLPLWLMFVNLVDEAQWQSGTTVTELEAVR